MSVSCFLFVMTEETRLIRLCFLYLRMMFLSSWKVKKSGSKWIVKRSKLMFVINSLMIAILAYIYIQVLILQHRPTKYKYSSIVFPLHTQFLVVVNIIFLLSGNTYNGKFINIINHFSPVINRFKRNFGFPPFLAESQIKCVLMKIIIYMTILTVFKLYVEFQLVLTYPHIFRIIYYFTSFCATFFSTHFIATMYYIKENYRYVNYLFDEILSQHELIAFDLKIKKNRYPRKCWITSFDSIPAKKGLRTKIEIWITGLMKLREVEEIVNEVFGIQMFLTLLLAFSAIILNVYYLVTLNLYETSDIWLNLCFLSWLFEAVAVLFANISAAESASFEANKISKEIFYFPLELNSWYFYNQIRYFVMFLYRYPMQFKAWVFHTVNYPSFFKVTATSLAITIIFLQCEFMRP